MDSLTWLKPCLCKIAFGWRSASSAAVNTKASDGFSRWGAFYLPQWVKPHQIIRPKACPERSQMGSHAHLPHSNHIVIPSRSQPQSGENARRACPEQAKRIEGNLLLFVWSGHACPLLLIQFT